MFKVRGVVKKYRAKCMVQGCNTSALFYPVFKHQIFNRILGRCWKLFWSIYQDDTIVKALGIDRVAGRLRLLLFILEEFNIGVSPKCYNEEGIIPIVETVKAAGYNISKGGIGCGEDIADEPHTQWETIGEFDWVDTSGSCGFSVHH